MPKIAKAFGGGRGPAGRNGGCPGESDGGNIIAERVGVRGNQTVNGEENVTGKVARRRVQSAGINGADNFAEMAWVRRKR